MRFISFASIDIIIRNIEQHTTCICMMKGSKDTEVVF